jgi:hypothetical protein
MGSSPIACAPAWQTALLEGQNLIVYLAEPGTADHNAMVLLDSVDLTATVPL